MSFNAVTALSEDEGETEHTPAPIPSPVPRDLKPKGAAKAKAKAKAKGAAKPRGRPKQPAVKKTMAKSTRSTKKPMKKPGVAKVEASELDATEELGETEEKVEGNVERKAEEELPMKRPASARSTRSTEDPPVMKKPGGKTKEFTVCKYKYKGQGAWGFKWDGKERLRVPRLFLAASHFWNQI